MFALTRVHDLDGAPLSVVRSYLPAHVAAGLERSAWRQPMHDLLLERYNIRLHRSVHTLRVARAMADVASLLGIGLADPVLRIQAATYVADGSPIRWTENFFREDRYEYVAEMDWPATPASPRHANPRARCNPHTKGDAPTATRRRTERNRHDPPALHASPCVVAQPAMSAMSAAAAPSKAATLRKHLRESRPLVSPGVYDCYSARLVESAGFKTARPRAPACRMR